VNKQRAINIQRERRKYRARRKLQGTSERPRLTVFRSHKNVSCQLVDDMTRKTLVSASTVEADVRSALKYGGNKAAAAVVGQKLAERAMAAGIKAACFDRSHYKYHGRIAALADAARAAGLSF
jgi:large subunit ribosomal protein L18